MKKWNQLLPEIESQGGTIFGVCGENPEEIEATKADWGIDYEFISDEKHEVATRFEHHLKLVVCRTTDSWWGWIHPWMSKYEHGCMQPGLLAITKDDKRLLQYVIPVNAETLGGASGRPKPALVWSHLKKGVETDKEIFLPNDIALDGGNSVRLQSVLYTSFISMKQGKFLLKNTFVAFLITMFMNKYLFSFNIFQMIIIMICLTFGQYFIGAFLAWLYFKYGSSSFATFLPFDMNTLEWKIKNKKKNE